MEILFIGTGSGKTSIKRNHSSFVIRSDNYNLLMDCGDGIAKALLQQNIEINSIDSLIITHLHSDHYSGIASLVTQMKLLKREKQFTIFLHNNFIETLRAFLNSVYMFADTVGFKINLVGYDFQNTVSITDDLSFLPKQNSHIRKKEETINYPSDMFVSSSLLVTCGNKKIFYTSDIGSEEDLYLYIDRAIDIMIVECSHVYPDQISTAFRKLKPGQLFITHIPDELENELFEWHKNLSFEIKENIKICSDGLSVIPA